jgi:hypothetical protein
LEDLLRCPNKYEEDVFPLAQQLVTGSKQLSELTENERDMLDRAVIDFSRPNSAKVVPVNTPTEVEQEKTAAGVEDEISAIDELDQYWWLPS